MKEWGASPSEQMRLAMSLHQNGNLSGAARIYDHLIERDPNNFYALHSLGLIELAHGRLESARQLMARSMAVRPANIQFVQNYAGVLFQVGDYESCQQACEQGLELEPANVYLMQVSASALFRLKRCEESLSRHDAVLARQPGSAATVNERACVLAEMRQYEAALAGFDRAAALDPRFAAPWSNKGAVLAGLDRHEEALAAYGQSVALEPRSAGAWCGHGNALTALNRHEEALAAYERALVISPDFANAWHSRGNALFQLGRDDSAAESYGKALAIAPAFAGAWHGRGNVFLRLCRRAEALAAYDKALAISPEFAGAHYGRGNVLADLDRCEEALAAYERALALDPRAAGIWYARAIVLQRLKRYAEALAAYDQAVAIEPHLEYARGMRLHARQQVCDWSDFEAECSALIAAIRRGEPAAPPFAILAAPSSGADQLRCAQLYVADRCRGRPAAARRNEALTRGCIRVAYLSADFRRHPVGYLLPGLFESHDRSRFEAIGISLGADDGSEIRARLVRSFDRFCDASTMSDDAVVELMRDLEIDILVDLMGHTMQSRPGILSARAAPIQVNYLGFLGTMGADFIDYIIADKIAVPLADQPFFTERIVHLPDCFLVNDRELPIAPRTPSRGEVGLPADGFLFCSFNSPYKIQKPIFLAWMRLLRRIEGSVLWLWEANDLVSSNLRKEAEAAGVDPNRLVFAPSLGLPDHLARHALADLALDTIPYNSGATGSGALWAGVPFLTCMGETFAGRMGASMLHAIGLPELVTKDLAEYEAMAVELAADPQLLESLRRKLAENRLTFPLFDTDRFRRHLEAAFLTMRERYRQGQAPEGFAVAPTD